MAGVTKITELEARKRALVTESEICREALQEEVRNLSLYGAGFFHKIDRVRSFGPWIIFGAPMVMSLFKLFVRRKAPAAQPFGFKGRVATAMLALRLYRQYGPLVRSLAGQFLGRRRSTVPEDRTPAANI